MRCTCILSSWDLNGQSQIWFPTHIFSWIINDIGLDFYIKRQTAILVLSYLFYFDWLHLHFVSASSFLPPTVLVTLLYMSVLRFQYPVCLGYTSPSFYIAKHPLPFSQRHSSYFVWAIPLHFLHAMLLPLLFCSVFPSPLFYPGSALPLCQGYSTAAF